MADENTPAFYPRVGQNIAKNFRSAQPPAFIEDPRAMDLPQYGDVDLSVPNQANLEMSRRMAQRQADLKRQQERDRSGERKGGREGGDRNYKRKKAETGGDRETVQCIGLG